MHTMHEAEFENQGCSLWTVDLTDPADLNVKHIVVEGVRLLAKPLCKSSFIPSHTYALGLQARPDPFHSACETVPDLGKH